MALGSGYTRGYVGDIQGIVRVPGPSRYVEQWPSWHLRMLAGRERWSGRGCSHRPAKPGGCIHQVTRCRSAQHNRAMPPQMAGSGRRHANHAANRLPTGRGGAFRCTTGNFAESSHSLFDCIAGAGKTTLLKASGNRSAPSSQRPTSPWHAALTIFEGFWDISLPTSGIQVVLNMPPPPHSKYFQ